ncbi:MAG: hypothetical protein V3U76_17105 [Granulosicoccus sp.]
MNTSLVNMITGFIGMALMATFVIGLAHSIATDFAGIDGAMPFIIIVGFVLCLMLYDFFDQCIQRRR